MRSHPRRRHVVPEKLDYDLARLRIRDGDVLLYRGRSLQSRIIQWVTGSPYSHAGLAVWWNARLMVLEAVGKGVIVTTLSSNVRHYRGDVEWYTSKEDLPDADRHKLVSIAQRELGKEYALWKAIVLGLRLLLKRGIERRDTLRKERKLFCSLYVAAVYNGVGMDLKEGVSDSFTSPNDIALSPLLKRVAALKRHMISQNSA